MTLLEALFSIIVYAKHPTQGIRPTPTPVIHSAPVVDERVERLGRYFAYKKSPLVGNEGDFIRVSDAYGIEWTLLPAIAGVESGFERAGNTHDFNPFGYMCKSGPCSFSSFSDAIERVARTITTNRAYAKFQVSGSVSELAPVYNYVSPEDWTSKITFFQREVISHE